MSSYSGRLVKVGIGKETVRGTAVAADYWARWETFDFFDNATTTFNQSAIGVLDKYSQAEITETWSEGTIAGKITDQTFGLILLGTFGSVSDAANADVSGNVYDHTYSEDQSNTSQSLTIVRVDPNQTLAYPNAMTKKLEVSVKAGDFVRHNTDYMAFPGSTTTATPAYIAENEFKSKYVTLKMATSVSGLSGASAIPVNNLKLTINKDAASYWIVGQNEPEDIFSQEVDITGEFQLLYDDNTYFTPRFANTIEALEVDIVNSDVTIGTAAHPEIKFTMPQCYLNTFKVENTLSGMVQQTIDFTATYSISAGYAIQAVLTNLVTAY